MIERLPFAFYTAPYLAVRPKNYGVLDYFDRLLGVYRLMVSQSLLWRRIKLVPTLLGRMIIVARTAGIWAEFQELKSFARALKVDRDLRRFHEGEATKLPDFYRHRLRRRLGRLESVLAPEKLIPTPAPTQGIQIV